MRSINSSDAHIVPIATPLPTGTPTKVRYQVLAVGWSLALLIYIQRQAFVRAVPKIEADLGLETSQTGLLASAFLVSYGLFQVPCGTLGDRLGARHLLTILVVGWSLMTGLSALADVLPLGVNGQFALLIVLRVLFGAFQAGGFPVWARAITDWMPASERGTAQGTVWMFSRLGGAMSPFVFFWLYQFFDSWRIPLVVVATVGLIWCLFFWPWFRNRPSESNLLNDEERRLIDVGRVPPAAAEPVPWLAMLCSSNIWFLSLMYGCVGFAGNFVTNLLPVYLTKYRVLPDDTVTLISAMPLAMGVIACPLGGYLSDRLTRQIGRKWGRRLLPSISLACAGLAVFSVPHVESVALLGFLFSASFFCNDMMMGPAWASCADISERYTGSVSGTMNMIGQFAGAAGMYLAGVLLQQGRAETLFLVFGCSYGLAALCWLVVDVTRPLVPITVAPTVTQVGLTEG